MKTIQTSQFKKFSQQEDQSRFIGLRGGIAFAFRRSGIQIEQFETEITNLINAIIRTHPLVQPQQTQQQQPVQQQPAQQQQQQPARQQPEQVSVNRGPYNPSNIVSGRNKNKILVAAAPVKNKDYYKPLWDAFSGEMQQLRITVSSVKNELNILIVKMCNTLNSTQLDLVLKNGLGLKFNAKGRGRQTIMTRETGESQIGTRLMDGLAKSGPNWW